MLSRVPSKCVGLRQTSAALLPKSAGSNSSAAPDRHLASDCHELQRPGTRRERQFSSWVAPHQRRPRLSIGSPYYQPSSNGSYTSQNGSATHAQRPLVNGKAIPFHVRDLPNAVAASDELSFSSPLSALYASSYCSAPVAQQQQSTKRRTYESDLIVLLDLDECLVHTRFSGSAVEASMYAHQVRNRQLAQQKQQQGGIESSLGNDQASASPTPPQPLALSEPVGLDSFRFLVPDATGTLAHVYFRPGVIDFLRHVTERYETHIFTAARPVYSDHVLDTLCAAVRSASTLASNGSSHDAEASIFSGRFYRQDCVWYEEDKAFVKDLSKLALFRNNPSLLSRAVLVDNNRDTFLKNPENGILVDSFFDNASDTALATVRDFLDRLDHVTDVRPVLQEQWRQLALLETQALQKLPPATRSITATSSAAAAINSPLPSASPLRFFPEVSSQVLHQDLTKRMSL